MPGHGRIARARQPRVARDADVGNAVEELLHFPGLLLLEAAQQQQGVALEHAREKHAAGVIDEAVRCQYGRLVVQLSERGEDLVAVTCLAECLAGYVDLQQVTKALKDDPHGFPGRLFLDPLRRACLRHAENEDQPRRQAEPQARQPAGGGARIDRIAAHVPALSMDSMPWEPEPQDRPMPASRRDLGRARALARTGIRLVS